MTQAADLWTVYAASSGGTSQTGDKGFVAFYGELDHFQSFLLQPNQEVSGYSLTQTHGSNCYTLHNN